jgi:hypothetical protein
MAARTRGLRRASLRDAIDRGDIPAEFVQRGSRTWYRIRSDLLDEALGRLRCKYSGCDRLALGKTGGCSPAHGAALALTGRERPPEVVAKIAAANRRYPAEERFCANPNCGKSLGVISEAVIRRGKGQVLLEGVCRLKQVPGRGAVLRVVRQEPRHRPGLDRSRGRRPILQSQPR